MSTALNKVDQSECALVISLCCRRLDCVDGALGYRHAVQRHAIEASNEGGGKRLAENRMLIALLQRYLSDGYSTNRPAKAGRTKECKRPTH